MVGTELPLLPFFEPDGMTHRVEPNHATVGILVFDGHGVSQCDQVITG